MNGFISKIQRYSTKDGPGIRSTVFLIECNLKCHWCSNPELIDSGKKYFYFRERCVKCGNCVKVAINDSIKLTDNGCKIDRAKCTNISQCADSCYYDAYEPVGFEISPIELTEKLLRDKDFYDQSKGGVTFSGGEPALQPTFLIETAKLLRKSGIHIALDTAGLVAEEIMKEIASNVDLILYDIKAFDSKLHKACTGKDNHGILNNAITMAKLNKPMIIRLTIVSEYNDDENDFIARLNFVKKLGDAVQQIDIIKYHNFGEGKYVRLGMDNKARKLKEPSDGLIHKYANLAAKVAKKVTING